MENNKGIYKIDNMKQTFFYATMALLILAGCTGTEYTIKGCSSEFADGKKVYYVRKINGEAVIDSTVVKNNSFIFKGDAPKPHWAKLGIRNSIEDSDGAITLEIIVEPGNIVVGDYDEENVGKRTATGTPLNDGMARFFTEYNAINKNTSLSFNEADELRCALISSYVKKNADNELGTFLFERYHRLLPKEMVLELCDILSAGNPTLYADLKEETIKWLEDNARAEEQAKSVLPGNNYKNVSGRLVDSTEVQLADVVAKNRFVLLEFWATWCAPCMGEVPFLLEAYGKYKDKGFEIFAVSLDDDRDAWVSTVKEKGMQWVNVLREGREATEKYGVRGVPSNYLIDCSTGKIIAVKLRGNELAEKLAEVM